MTDAAARRARGSAITHDAPSELPAAVGRRFVFESEGLNRSVIVHVAAGSIEARARAGLGNQDRSDLPSLWFIANFESLRQILDAVRAILYFAGRGDAGLTRARGVRAGSDFALWVTSGLLVTTWYDRKRL